MRNWMGIMIICGATALHGAPGLEGPYFLENSFFPGENGATNAKYYGFACSLLVVGSLGMHYYNDGLYRNARKNYELEKNVNLLFLGKRLAPVTFDLDRLFPVQILPADLSEMPTLLYNYVRYVGARKNFRRVSRRAENSRIAVGVFWGVGLLGLAAETNFFEQKEYFFPAQDPQEKYGFYFHPKGFQIRYDFRF